MYRTPRRRNGLMRFAILLPRAICAISLLACTTTTTLDAPPGDGSGDGTPVAEAVGVDELGKDCIAACGAGDDRKCTMPSDKCKSNLCIVDPTQPGTAHIAYCTVDCTHGDCPAGWHCEDVKA